MHIRTFSRKKEKPARENEGNPSSSSPPTVPPAPLSPVPPSSNKPSANQDSDVLNSTALGSGVRQGSGNAAHSNASPASNLTSSPPQNPDTAQTPPKADTAVDREPVSVEEENLGQEADASSREAPFTSEDDEGGLWTDALNAYLDNGGDWPKVKEFLVKIGPDSKNATIMISSQRFDEHRSKHEEIWGILSKTMGVTRTIVKVFGDPIKDVFSPASIIFSIVNVFFDACERVSSAYEIVQELFDELGHFLNRLQHYKSDLTSSLRGTVVKILRILFEVIGFTTSATLNGQMDRLKRFLKNIPSEDITWKDKKAELDRLTDWELKQLVAESHQDGKQTLKNTNSILDSIRKAEGSFVDADRDEKLKPSSTCRLKFSQEIIKSLVPRTGKWVHEKPPFQAWKTGKHPILLISGPAGVGKTYLCGRIIKELSTTSSGNDHILVTSYLGGQKLDFKEVLRTWAFDLTLKNKSYRQHVNKIIEQEDDLSKSRSIEDLWEKLFIEFLPKTTKEERRNHTHMYLVLDGLEATSASLKEIDTFLTLMSNLQHNPRNNCNHKDTPSETGFHFHVLISARLDRIDPESYTSLNHFPVKKDDFRDDIRQYIKTKLEANTLLDKTKREEYIKELNKKADTFAYAIGMDKWIRTAKTPDEISQQMENRPTDSDGMIHLTLNQVENETNEVCDALNTLLTWIIYSRTDVTLGDLDVIFKIKSRYGRGISNLKNMVKSHPSLFGITTRTPQTPMISNSTKIKEADEAKEETTATYAEIVSENLKLERKRVARLNDTLVSIAQPAIEEFFNTKGKGNRKVGVDPQSANLDLARFCMSFFCNEKIYKSWRSSKIAEYAENYFHYHVRDIDLNRTSDHDKAEISALIIKMFFDQDVLRRWTTGSEAIHISSEFLDPGNFTVVMLRWLRTTSLDGSSIEPLSQWLMDVKESSTPTIPLLRPMAELFASRWLNELSKPVSPYEFAFLKSYVDMLKNDLQICEDKLMEVLQSSPECSTANYELAEVHLRKDNKSAARECYLKSYHGFDATDDISNQVLAALKILGLHGNRDEALDILENVWEKATSIQLTEEELHYAYVKSLFNELKKRSEFGKICQYFNRLATDTTPTGESRLTRSQSVQIIEILEECLKEARLTGHILIPILQDYLARYLFQTTSEDERAFELWTEVLQHPNILEDWDESNDVSGFLMLVEVFITTGVDDEDANSAMSLFLQYLFYDGTWKIPSTPWIQCDGCGEDFTWGFFQVCRYCKADFCDKCLQSMKDEELGFRLCHPLHEFFKPWGPSPAERQKGYVEVDGKEVEFVEWVDGLKKKWEV
ncbi:NACHT and TPR domain-containing protein [Lasiodiplodia theobromae]|uniref:NACHT and TPR domain-containing protein n=1 Tax=Lasiodiplodia theobromae TaxID=45133 RepID=UPI0015C3C438|nr:NACHT and TPR domain-containing protein [Lasiodiplodia theobromae]KAF4537679.1 NACHT and TPR domain-containing protein [Lasiodiplodia theobromae]